MSVSFTAITFTMLITRQYFEYLIEIGGKYLAKCVRVSQVIYSDLMF